MSEIPFSQYKKYEPRPVSWKDYNRLVDLIQQNTINSAPGYMIRRSSVGTTLVVKNSASASAPCPFDVSVMNLSGSYSATVRPGTVNQLLPDNISDSFSFDHTEVIYVKVEATTDGQAVTSCTLAVEDTAPTAQEPTPFALPTEVDVTLAVIISGVAYRTIDCGSVQLTPIESFTTSPSSPADPGLPNVTQYYVWSVGVV